VIFTHKAAFKVNTDKKREGEREEDRVEGESAKERQIAVK